LLDDDPKIAEMNQPSAAPQSENVGTVLKKYWSTNSRVLAVGYR
jgi:hypothetical protein